MKNTTLSARATLAVAVALGIGISLGGCAAGSADNDSGAGSSQTEQGTTTDSGDAPADNASSDGFVDPDGEVPDWVAAGFPIYPGSEVAGFDEISGVTMISFSVPSVDPDGKDLYNWLVDQYSQNGWTTRNLDDEHMSFDADNADGRIASINVTKATYVMTAEKG